VSEIDFQTIRGIGFAGAVVIAVALERIAPHARAGGSWRANVGLWCVNAVVMGALCGGCACTVAAWAAEARVGLLNVLAAPAWLAALVTMLGLDLVSYAWHRANHAVPFLWRLHRVHHSDRRFSVSTGVRFHPGELVLSLPLRLLAVVAIGAPVAAVLAFEALFTLANLLEHGDIDYPRALERRLQHVLVTPALHRRHHGRDWRLLGTNFGTVFTLWDRLGGTYAESTSDAMIRTGLPGLHGEPGILAALLMPLRLIPRTRGGTPET
jgi:sterol desaturase/sphingolipid hydroxylase (fatty acid hydroxylase superfamily)